MSLEEKSYADPVARLWLPHEATEKAEAVVARIKTRVDKSDTWTATIGNVNVSITADGTWEVAR